MKVRTWIMYKNEPWYVSEINTDTVQLNRERHGDIETIIFDKDNFKANNYPLIEVNPPKFNEGDKVLVDHPNFKSVATIIQVIDDTYFRPYRVKCRVKCGHISTRVTPYSIAKVDL